MSSNIQKEIEAGKFQEFCFAVETLLKYNVEAEADENGNPIINYNYGNGISKVYRPIRNGAENKCYFKNPQKAKIPKVFGMDQLPPEGELVVITGGEKDVMTFDGYYKIPAVTLQSENAPMPPELISELKSRYKTVAICYDNDDTGRKNSKKHSEKFGLARIELPEDLEGKDIYDFTSSGRNKEELQKLIDLALKTQQENKTSFTGKEILESQRTYEFIIEGILPKSNLVGLIGGSDTGKSLLSLQFAICYILNKPFLGSPVNGGKNVIFFSFEDDFASIKNRLSKLLTEFSESERDSVANKIHFELDPEGIEQKIENLLELYPDTGVIIIDPLTEILNGTDMNNPASVREQMQLLKKVSLKYDLTVIFINHITKNAEEGGKLSKSNSIGSQAIEAKSRVMFEMKKRLKGSLIPSIELGVVKGNDINEKFKTSGCRFCLNFDSDSFWFKLDETGPSVSPTPNIKWDLIFGENKKMKAKEIVHGLKTLHDYDEKKSRVLIAELLEAHRIQHGIYGNPTILRKNEDGRPA